MFEIPTHAASNRFLTNPTLSMPTERWETENYLVSLYHRSDECIVFVFMSAGNMAPGNQLDEFKKTLSNFDVSMAFIRDKKTLWFNHTETREVFDRLEAVRKRYRFSGAMGESMGASGALLFSERSPSLQRVLAITPQYSITHPFIAFDHRFEGIARTIPRHFHASFSRTRLRDECVIVYGNLEWRDGMHASAFEADGFSMLYLDGSTHNAAAFLKTRPERNYLIELLRLFTDFTLPFSRERAASSVVPFLARDRLRPGFSFADDFEKNRSIQRLVHERSSADVGRDLGPNRAAGKPALQSSICVWSRRPGRDADASGAVTGEINGFYNFHTNFEPNPWWRVDLQAPHRIGEVRIYNYLSDPGISGRSSRFWLEISLDDQHWGVVYERTDDTPFGGADGHPFIWRPSAETVARYVRISLRGKQWLHLDQVEVFGDPIDV